MIYVFFGQITSEIMWNPWTRSRRDEAVPTPRSLWSSGSRTGRSGPGAQDGGIRLERLSFLRFFLIFWHVLTDWNRDLYHDTEFGVTEKGQKIWTNVNVWEDVRRCEKLESWIKQSDKVFRGPCFRTSVELSMVNLLFLLSDNLGLDSMPEKYAGKFPLQKPDHIRPLSDDGRIHWP